MAKVTVIPATINKLTSEPIGKVSKRKVAAYARVSTDQEEQQSSYEAQVSYYEEYIKSRDDWQFVSVFADEGISGTSTAKRKQFLKMIDEALAGNIQLIITKSVSRFARNTIDSLSYIRKLKEHGVECYFEKEGLWTFDTKSETILAIMSSLAQEESRSISENVKWGLRKKMADGKFSMAYSQFLGYDKGEDGNLVINEEEAKIVRRIYGLFIQGHSPYKIAKILTEDGIPTPGGKKVWGKEVIRSILSNEKYAGNALLQKTYISDFLSKKVKKNNGEIPQYYIEGNHEPIISPEVFNRVQTLLKATGNGSDRNSCISIFSSKIKCGDCGSWYGSKVWHSNDKYRRVVWQCNHKFDGEKCTTPHLDEDKIKEIYIKALNLLAKDKEIIIKGFEEIKDSALSVNELKATEKELNVEINVVTELIEKIIDENARIAQDQKEYEKRYQALVERYETAKSKLEKVQDEIVSRQAERNMMDNFIKVLKEQPQQIDTFDENTWYALCDYITVYSKDKISVRFQNGIEIYV